MALIDLLHQPSNWSLLHREVREVELCNYSSEYNNVKMKLTGPPLETLTRITRLQNKYLYQRYMLRKLEYEALGVPFTEVDLLHATDEKNIPSIIKDNLDWRKAKRVKFGKGVSFSPSAEYANQECSWKNGYYRAIIVCKVLVGRKYLGRSHMSVPPLGYDTTYGNGSNVFVKYYDDEFYPVYAAYYELQD